jgi:hypothetical protein
VVNLTLRCVRETIVAVEKQSVLHISLCVGSWACAFARAHVAFIIQHATSMPHIVLSFVASLASPNFSKLSYKGAISGRKKICLTYNVF